MDYKNLDLDRVNLITQTIQEMPFIKKSIIKSNDSAKTIIELIPVEGELGLLTIFHVKNGKTTLVVNQGKNVELSKKVADIIAERHKRDVSSVIGSLTLSGFKEDDFDLIVDYFKEEKFCELDKIKHEKPKCIQAKLKNGYGSCDLTYYSNGTLFIQGKASILKLEISQTISILCPNFSDDLVKEEKNFFKIDMLEDDIDRQTRIYLPNSYDYLKGKLIDYLKQAVVLSRIQLPTLPDYSCKVDTVFVVIEGVLKKILKEEYGIEFDNFGEVFVPDQSNQKFKLHPDTALVVKSETLADKLETLYTLFNKKRHNLLHFHSPVAVKDLISNEKEADTLFTKCMILIDETIKTFLEKNG